MKNKSKLTLVNKFGIILLSILSTITLVPIITIPIIASTKHNENNFIELDKPNKVITSLNSTKNYSADINNALEKDAIEKANSDTTLVYFMSWGATFHKYGFLSHMLKVLEINSNKNIVVFIRDCGFNLDIFSKFKNVRITIFKDNVNLWSTKDVLLKNLAENSIFNTFVNVVNEIDNFDFYCDDYFLLKNYKNIIGDFKLTTKDIDLKDKMNLMFNKLSFLYKANSINIFSDGTVSYLFFDNELYAAFIKNKNAIYNNKYVSEYAYDYYKNKVLNNETIEFKTQEDYFYYMYSLVTSNTKDNNYSRVKYFLPSIEMINEINADDTALLDINNTDYFNPYNTLNAGFIEMFKSFKPETMKLLYIAMNKPNFNPNDYNVLLDNKINYVYSGRLLSGLNQNDLITEAKKVIYLYELAKENLSTNEVDKIQIVYKGHPRESLDITKTICEIINQIDSSLNPQEWFVSIDQTIPYELYLISGVFIRDNVKLFQTYSTIALFLYDYNKNKDVEKFLFSQNELNEINNVFGENSLIFPENKRVIF